MAKITYQKGIKCKKCGRIEVQFNGYQTYILCQSCGTHMMTYDSKNKKGEVTKDAEIITVKVTHKLFKEIYEEV